MENNIIQSDSGQPFKEIRDFLGEPSDDITIFVPYVNTKTLSQLLPHDALVITLVTSWKIQDILYGASSLDLYKYSKERNIRLYINNRIHLKAFMLNWEKCIIGSANLTERGLGISEEYNYELDARISSVDINTHIYFRKILAESVLMTDKLFDRYQECVSKLPSLPQVSDDIIGDISEENELLLSSLPMTKSIDVLFLVSSGRCEGLDKETLKCAIHDIALYKITCGMSQDEYLSHLKCQFFDAALIKQLLRYINIRPRYFGEVKQWMQENCKDVPVPSRRDLTGNVQVLYRWIVELSAGHYKVDRPNHSERIYRI